VMGFQPGAKISRRGEKRRRRLNRLPGQNANA
jgi:hypothetical protein